MKKFYITTPIYYANDQPHIGHAYTTIVADVLARYHRLAGDEVFFLTGTDEHGSKVAESAEAAGKSPQEFCDEISAHYQTLWDRLDISNDDFIRTTSNYHKKGVERFLSKLHEVGAVYEGQYEGLYCTGCENFITEKELEDGKCPDHNKEPQVVKEKNYFFKLKEYLPKVKELLDSGGLKILPESRHNEVLGLLRQGLEDFSISRESVKWGIEIPFNKKQVTYVWVEALQNYITALGYGDEGENFKKFWPADIHLMAKDIIKFHALYWPAMLIAAGLAVPKVIFAHGFFTINGHKMSKSLGNAIDPDALIDELGSDAVRYLLLSQFPFGADGDIKAGSFAIQYNSDLANSIGNLTSRVLAMTEKYYDGKVPEKDFEFSDEVAGIWRQYKKAMKEFQIDKAVEIIKKLNAFCDGYVERQKPWELAKKDPEQLAKVIYNLLEAIRHLGLMIYPIMPQTAEKILASLGQTDWQKTSLKELQDWGGLELGVSVSKGDSLFPRLGGKEKE
ncbi:MAG TPA: methionine--tRNA ligase [Patescibacteria group bacterium]|nr:methionine--tRNA ligase [Patescibacteria group bacterium]